MADDSTVQMDVKITGQDEIARLVKVTEEYRELLKILRAEYEAGDIAADAYRREHLALIGPLGQATRALNKLRGAVKEVAETYEVLTGIAQQPPTMPLLDEMVRKANETTASQKAVARALDETSAATGKVETSSDKAAKANENLKKKTGETGRQMLEAGRIIQDFVQGGVGGILNNVEGFTRALGGGPGLAGLFTAVGVAAYLAKDHIREFVDLFDEKAHIPVASLRSFQDAVNNARKEVGKLYDATNEQTTALGAEKDALDEVIRKHHEQAEAIKKLRRLQGAGTEERNHERAGNLQALVGGQQQELVGEVAQSFTTPEQRTHRAQVRKELQRDIEDYGNRLRRTKDQNRRIILGNLIRETQRRLSSLDATERSERGKAESMVAGAVVQGKESDLQDVLRHLPADSKFRKELAGQTNAGLEANEELTKQIDENLEEGAESGKGLSAHLKKRRAKAKAEEKKAETKAKHDADKAKREAEQFREQNIRHFAGFDKMPGFAGNDAVAVEYAGVGRDRTYEAQLRNDARQALLYQNPDMSPAEATHRAAQYPEYLRNRVANIQAGGGRGGDEDAREIEKARDEFQREFRRNQMARDQGLGALMGATDVLKQDTRQLTRMQGRLHNGTKSGAGASGLGY